jgi:steroid 5-alpha reductase family enzyme
MWPYLLTTLGVSLGINIIMFLVAYRYRTDRLTDASYALTFIVLALYGLSLAPAQPFSIVLVAMVIIWAVRLGGFLLIRIHRTGKDARFDGMREDFAKFGRFWLAQGLSVWVILLPTLLALRHPGDSGVGVAGLVLWAIGLALEATADWQKFRFSANPANQNRWIDTGVWQYSRHPNYFGEILVWTGVFIYTLPALTGLEWLIGLASPLFITTLLLFVSGLPILEKSADARWGSQPAYQAYKRRTSILVPWFSRSAK